MFGPDVVLRRKIKWRLDVVVGSINVLGQGVEVAEAARRPREGRGAPPREEGQPGGHQGVGVVKVQLLLVEEGGPARRGGGRRGGLGHGDGAGGISESLPDHEKSVQRRLVER